MTAGAGVTFNGTASVTITGTAAQINTALAGLAYTGNLDFNGADTLTVATSDATATDTDTIAITVNPVNDAPINTVPGAQTVAEDTILPIAGVSVADIDSSALTTTLSVARRHPQCDRRRRRHRQRHRQRNHRRHGSADQRGAGGPRLYRKPRLQRRRHPHGRDQRRDLHRHRHDRDHCQSSERHPGAQSRREQLDDRRRGLSDDLHQGVQPSPSSTPMSRSSTPTVQACLRDHHTHEPSRWRQSDRYTSSSPGSIIAAGSTVPGSSRSQAPRHAPTIRRRCSKSCSTPPILRPRPVSSTWSSTTGRPKAILRMRSSRSWNSTPMRPQSISTPRRSREQATTRRSPRTTPVAITDTDTLIGDPDIGSTIASATIRLTNPQAGDLLTATQSRCRCGRYHRFRLQPGHRNPDALRRRFVYRLRDCAGGDPLQRGWRHSGCGKPHHSSHRQRRNTRQPARNLACYGRGRQRRPDQHRAGRADRRRGHHFGDRRRLGG